MWKPRKQRPSSQRERTNERTTMQCWYSLPHCPSVLATNLALAPSSTLSLSSSSSPSPNFLNRIAGLEPLIPDGVAEKRAES